MSLVFPLPPPPYTIPSTHIYSTLINFGGDGAFYKRLLQWKDAVKCDGHFYQRVTLAYIYRAEILRFVFRNLIFRKRV